MNYKQTLEFMYSQLPAFHRIGKAAYKNDLNNSLRFDEYLGNPHNHYKTIHVGGTNGKGSVSHMIASILMEAGYKTGLYTSPHLLDFRERIKVNRRKIPEREVVAFIKKHADFISSLKPSFFEMTVAMAFDYFKKAETDIAVVEVGLGGRLDSTNIINPILSVITNIGHDHMDLLGDSLRKVASEKAGIIKVGVPVVISETSEEVNEIFIQKALTTESEIYFADVNFNCIMDEGYDNEDFRKFKVVDICQNIELNGESPLCGDYQSKNIQGVFQAVRVLRKTLNINDENILNGIKNVVKNTSLSGRWQLVCRSPMIICDTGHNFEGLKYTMDQVRRIPCSELRFVLGFVSDKDVSSVLTLFPAGAVYYFARASVPRSMNEHLLEREAARAGLKGKAYGDVKSALSAAIADSSKDDCIYVGGSTFVVADAIQQLKSNK